MDFYFRGKEGAWSFRRRLKQTFLLQLSYERQGYPPASCERMDVEALEHSREVMQAA